MTPFYFGASNRQLYGAYDPPAAGGRRAALFCQPWAREYLLAHPTVRLAARALARAGWHALRFDYSGTGDSAGSDQDVSLEQWQEDIRTAIRELQDVAGVQRVTLIGMRLGGALAAMVAASNRDIERLVLWDPVIDGGRHVNALREPAVAWERDLAPPLPEDEVIGAPLPPALRDGIRSISPAMFPSSLPRSLLLNTHGDRDAYAPLEARLVDASTEFTREHVPDVQVWQEEWGRGGVGLAARAVERVNAWLT